MFLAGIFKVRDLGWGAVSMEPFPLQWFSVKEFLKGGGGKGWIRIMRRLWVPLLRVFPEGFYTGFLQNTQIQLLL